jgi:hypothetical protein
MIQDVLADPDWDGVLTAEDERGLTPLFWQHVLPYGEVKLDNEHSVGARRLTASGPPWAWVRCRAGRSVGGTPLPALLGHHGAAPRCFAAG